MTGLCTQANNGIIVDDPDLAADFLDEWNLLKAAGNAYPPTLAQANSTAKTFNVDGGSITQWFAPTSDGTGSRLCAQADQRRQGRHPVPVLQSRRIRRATTSRKRNGRCCRTSCSGTTRAPPTSTAVSISAAWSTRRSPTSPRSRPARRRQALDARRRSIRQSGHPGHAVQRRQPAAAAPRLRVDGAQEHQGHLPRLGDGNARSRRSHSQQGHRARSVRRESRGHDRLAQPRLQGLDTPTTTI